VFGSNLCWCKDQPACGSRRLPRFLQDNFRIVPRLRSRQLTPKWRRQILSLPWTESRSTSPTDSHCTEASRLRMQQQQVDNVLATQEDGCRAAKLICTPGPRVGRSTEWLRVGQPRGRSRVFCLHVVLNGSEAHPASCPIAAGGSFPGYKTTTHVQEVPRSRKRGSISSPSYVVMAQCLSSSAQGQQHRTFTYLPGGQA
jgi:hypothetical protein